MTELFIPKTNNRPAKVKDLGLINLVMAGGAVYNSKSGEIIFLPAGKMDMDSCYSDLTGALFSENGIQCVDCSGSEDSIFSLAERYVRDYKDVVLSWMFKADREIRFSGWAESEDKAYIKVCEIDSLISSTIRKHLPAFSFIAELRPSAINALVGGCETEKGAVNENPGLKCAACGHLSYPNSPNKNHEAPVNSVESENSVVDVHTPGAHTIPLLCEQLGLQPRETLKAMLYTVLTKEESQKLLFAMIRGDRNISIQKLSAYVESRFKEATFRKAEPNEIIHAFGEVAGFCGPIGVPDSVEMVADLTIVNGKNFVVGGNRPDYHRTGCCWGRDFEPPFADIMLYEDGGQCPNCGGELKEVFIRPICSIESYSSETKGEPVLSFRDKEGEHRLPYRWKGSISLESLILAVYETRSADIQLK